MVLLWELKVRISPDNLDAVTKDIQRKFKQTGDQIEQSVGKGTEQGVKKAESSFGKLKNIISAVFISGGLLAFGRKLLSLWSDAEEFGAKFRTVFKWVEDEATKTFQTMAENVWRANLDLVQFAGTVGNVIKPLGFWAEEALKLSENIVKLWLDVASFNNVSDAQAIHAFTSALTWEREALKSLGIVISETDVQNKAYALGLAKQGEELSKSAKALATYQLFLDNTKDAQGDAIRTGDSFANQLKRLQGIIKTTFSDAGKNVAKDSAGMLKSIGIFVQWFGESFFALLIELGKGIGDFFSSIWEAIFEVLEWLGVNLGEGADRVSTFGNVLLVVLHALNLGIRGVGLTLKSFILLSVAVAKDVVNVFGNMGDLIGHAFGAVASSIAWLLVAWVNNAISYGQQGINKVIGLVNSFTAKVTQITGIGIGKIWPVAERGFLSVTDISWQYLSNLSNSWKKTTWEMWANWSTTADKVADDFLDLGAYAITQENKMAESSVRNASKTAGAYSTAFDQASSFAGGFWEEAETAGKKAGWWAKKASEEIKKMEEEIKKAEDTYKDLEKATDKANDAGKKYAEAQKKYFEELWQEIRKVNDELRKNQEAFDIEKQVDQQAFANQEIGARAETEADIASIKEELAELAKEELKTYEDIEENNKKKLELEQKLLQANKELEETKRNIALIDAGAVAEAERRASLTDAQRRGEDFAWEQAKKQAEFELEKQKLERTKAIYDVFNAYQFKSVAELEALKESERVKSATIEEQELIIKLANERIQLLQARDAKIQAEREVANATRQLIKQTADIANQNIDALDQKYRDLIGTINSAIQAQRELQSVQASGATQQRYKGWPVSAGTPYLVGENPDGSINPSTTEMFVPNTSGSIVPAQQVQDALRTLTTQNVDQSKNATITWPIIVNKEMDLMRILERAFFRF